MKGVPVLEKILHANFVTPICFEEKGFFLLQQTVAEPKMGSYQCDTDTMLSKNILVLQKEQEDLLFTDILLS